MTSRATCGPTSRSRLTPWLGGVYVTAPFRRRGIGSALARRIEQEAARLGFEHLYLYTPTQEGFYANRGWSTIEHCIYLGIDVALMCKPLHGDGFTGSLDDTCRPRDEDGKESRAKK